MKKLILSVTAVAGLSLAGHAQGILFADSTANATAGTDVTIQNVPDHTQDVNLELLYGTTAGTVNTPIVTLLLSSAVSPTTGTIGGVYTASGDVSALGSVLDNSGVEYNLPAGTYFCEILGWTGNYSSEAAAAAAGQATGASQIFSVTAAASPAPPADVSGMGVLALSVPEPSTLAMAGVGLASMLIFRRRNK